jgi:hypothetical protein
VQHPHGPYEFRITSPTLYQSYEENPRYGNRLCCGKLLDVPPEYAHGERFGHLVCLLICDKLVVPGNNGDGIVTFIVIQGIITWQRTAVTPVSTAGGLAQGDRKERFSDIAVLGFSGDVYHGFSVLVSVANLASLSPLRKTKQTLFFMPCSEHSAVLRRSLAEHLDAEVCTF